MRLPVALILCLLCAGCAGAPIKPPHDFFYAEIEAGAFTLASWQKITNVSQPYVIYIEGDGQAFNRLGQPTQNPTPKGNFARALAFDDPSANVVYLARPCQYIQSAACEQLYWTTGRFAQTVISSMYAAIKQIAGHRPIVLVGYSGGAQIAGLLAVTTDLNVAKLITIAGNLDHTAWTQHHNLPPLSNSLNLVDYQKAYLKIPQIHFAGSRDLIMPPKLILRFVNGRWPVHVIKNATHDNGFDAVKTLIWQ